MYALPDILLLIIALLAFAAACHMSFRSIRFLKHAEQKDIISPAVTVIIPFRNEEKNLPELMRCLALQQWFAEDEIILVNDHSADGSVDCIPTNMDGLSLQLIQLENSQTGKKQAIKAAIALAKNHWLIQLDADVYLNQNWLASVRKHLHPDLSLLIGLVRIKGRNIVAGVESCENALTQITAVYSAAMGSPILCSGANLAYTRPFIQSLYDRNYKTHISSGDDQFLLEFAKKHHRKISLIAEKNAIAEVQANSSFGAFFSQKFRWASKSSHIDDQNTLSAGLLVVGLCSLFIMSVVRLTQEMSWLAVATCLLFWAAQLVIVAQGSRILATRLRPGFLLLFPIVYPVIVLVVSILSLFIRPQWKGRKIRIR